MRLALAWLACLGACAGHMTKSSPRATKQDAVDAARDVSSGKLAELDSHKGGESGGHAIDALGNGDPAVSIKGTLSHVEDAPKDTKLKAETAYATGGHAQPVIEAEVLLRDEVDAPEMTRQRFDIIAHDFDARRRLSPGDDDASHDGSFAPTVTQVPTRKPLAADNESIRNAVREWFDNRTAAEEKYGHIKDWDTSGVTVMSYLFDCSCRLNSSIPVFLALFSRVPEPNCSARSIGDEYSHKALKRARSRRNCRTKKRAKPVMNS